MTTTVIQRRRSDATLITDAQAIAATTMSRQESSHQPVIPLCFESPSSNNLTRRRRSERSVQIGSPDYSLYATDMVISPKSTTRLPRRPTYTFEKTKRVQKMIWRAIYVVVVLMWIGGYRHYHSTNSLLEDFLRLLESENFQSAETKEHLKNMKVQVHELEERLEKMTKMNHSFDHEVRMLEEMAVEDVDMHLTGTKLADSSSVSKWIQDRKRSLQDKVQLLKDQVQEQSKKTVLEKYGPGPYRVKFTVNVLYNSQGNGFGSGDAQHKSNFSQNRGIRIKKEFIVELAPLNVMPHAIHLFLELMERQLWQDTVFLHTDQSEHVMPAAPVHYSTHNLLQDRLNALEFTSLAFPEYSKEYPHNKYTLGFANKGPTFYINTMDNRKHHGPGGQDHHLMPEDADPCFGIVIQGQDVIDTLIDTGIQAQNRLNPRASHPWKDQDDMFWTRIVSVVLL